MKFLVGDLFNWICNANLFYSRTNWLTQYLRSVNGNATKKTWEQG